MRIVLALRRLAHLHRRVRACPGGSLPAQHDVLREEIGRACIAEAARRAALARLDRRPRGHAPCHGDLRLENVLSTTAGPRIIVWRKACAGHPAADVARAAFVARFGRLASKLTAPLGTWTGCVGSSRSGTSPAMWPARPSGSPTLRHGTCPSPCAGRPAENEMRSGAEAERLAAEG